MDFEELYSGNFGLGYAYQWRRLDRETIGAGLEYERTTSIKLGTSESNELSITSTLGASAFGISAQLEIAFSKKIMLSREEMYTESYRIAGADGHDTVFTLWQLMELFLLLRKTGPDSYERVENYRLTLLEKSDINKPYTVIDRFDGTTQLTNETQSDSKRFPAT